MSIDYEADQPHSRLHSLSLWLALLLTFSFLTLSYAADIARNQVSLSIDYVTVGAYFRVLGELSLVYEAQQSLANLAVGVGLLSYMVMVVSIATLNSRRVGFHMVLTFASFGSAVIAHFLSILYNNQIAAAIALALNTRINREGDWQLYLGVLRKYQEAYGFWGASYNSWLDLYPWLILVTLGFAALTIRTKRYPDVHTTASTSSAKAEA